MQKYICKTFGKAYEQIQSLVILDASLLSQIDNRLQIRSDNKCNNIFSVLASILLKQMTLTYHNALVTRVNVKVF